MKSLFNFYLEDSDKELAVKKLEQLCGQQSKGLLAAYYRVMTTQLINTPEERLQPFIKLIMEDYTYNTKRNKRSRL